MKLTDAKLIELILNFIVSMSWPAVVLFTLIYLKQPITNLLGRLKNAELPGGINLGFSETLKAASEIAEDISNNPEERKENFKQIPLNQTNQMLLERGLRPSPSRLDFQSYKSFSLQDPVLALAGLRTEVEVMVRNLSDGYGVDVKGLNSSLQILSKLHRERAIYTRQYELGRKVIELCNTAMHGLQISSQEANTVIDIATVLASEYIDWLSWGFPDP